MEIWPGTAYPLGATYDGAGTNFALFSEVADRVELCLFDAEGVETRVRAARGRRVRLARVPAGRRAGPALRVPRARAYDPTDGPALQPGKLLLDPYAKAIDGRIDWHESLFSYHFGDPDSCNDDDSAQYMPKCVVINPFFDWGVDRPPRRAYAESVIYEAHVKGMTERHPDVPENLRGTYAGIAHPAIIEHLQELGVTAIELMPVHHFVNDSTLVERGCRTTGATTRSASSRRTTSTPRTHVARAGRSRSSRRWCARCTRPTSR